MVLPEKSTMDKSGANKAAMDNTVEQDYRGIKRVTRAMLNFKFFRSAKNVLAGIELMHMIRKGQLAMEGADDAASAWPQCKYSLA